MKDSKAIDSNMFTIAIDDAIEIFKLQKENHRDRAVNEISKS